MGALACVGLLWDGAVWLWAVHTFAWVLAHWLPYRRRVVRENLRIAFPHMSDAEHKAIEHEFYAYFLRLLREIASMGWVSPVRLLSAFSYEGEEYLLEALGRGRPLFLLVPHYGNWELAGLYLALTQPADVVAVYKPQRMRWVDSLLRRWRQRFGSTLISMEEAARFVLRYANRQYIMVFIADQNPVHLHVNYWVKFFGRWVPVWAGAERLARRVGAAVLFACAVPDGATSYRIVFEKICDEPAHLPAEGSIMEAFMRRLEEQIRRLPPYWLWTHRRWKHSHRWKEFVR